MLVLVLQCCNPFIMYRGRDLVSVIFCFLCHSLPATAAMSADLFRVATAGTMSKFGGCL